MNEVSKKQKFVILYKYVSYKAFESIMEKWALKASFPFESNDPLEYVAQHTEHKMGRYMNIHSPQDEPPPFFSFSRKMSDVTMWGQYADYARGVCLVFKFPLSENCREYWSDENADELSTYISCSMASTTENKTISLAGVKYSENRFTPGDFNKEKPDIDTVARALIWRMFTPPIKADSWEYEDEVRIIEHCNNASLESNNMLLYDWPMNYLYAVIIGSNSPYPSDYIKQKIKLSYAKTNQKNFFWGELCNCYVVRATIHPTKFAYEAYPFSDRMENDLLEKIMSLTKHSYDEGETWYELSKKMLNDLTEWRNDVIRTFAKKLVLQRSQYTTANTDTDEKILFDITRHIITNSSIFAKIFQEETLSVEDIQAAITSRPEERENIKDMAQWFINQGINAIAKKVHFELDDEIDSVISKYFKETKNSTEDS